MKRFGNLYHRIYDIDNLYLAYSKAKKGKGKTYGVIQFEKDLDNNILSLHKELSERSYITSKKNFCRKVSALNKKNITPHDYKMAICSWLGWAKHCNSKHLIKKIIKNEKIQ